MGEDGGWGGGEEEGEKRGKNREVIVPRIFGLRAFEQLGLSRRSSESWKSSMWHWCGRGEEGEKRGELGAMLVLGRGGGRRREGVRRGGEEGGTWSHGAHTAPASMPMNLREKGRETNVRYVSGLDLDQKTHFWRLLQKDFYLGKKPSRF